MTAQLMWYSASLLFRSIRVPAVDAPELWEEVVILIQAADMKAATVIAIDIGHAREHEYAVETPRPHSLRWVFSQVERIHAIDQSQLAHGTELFARYLRASEVNSLLTPFDDDPASLR